jgi:glycosyltransferase involved in cell wall biosynthesis
MKILVANHWLKKLGGSETFTYTLIGELVRQGHDVSYFTWERGKVSQAIEKDFKVSHQDSGSYDLILCSHNTTVGWCRANFQGFIIQTCHGTIPKLEQPHMKADAFVAISKEVELHLLKSGVDKPIKVIHNGIDLDRFKHTTIAVQDPHFVLSLSHSEQLNTYLRNYFSSRHVHFDALNKYQNPQWSVEQVMNLSDLVISCGRGAMEALACGRPVIVMDHRPYMPPCADGIITPVNIDDLLFTNFSGRCRMRDPYDPALIDEALDTIDIYTSDRMRHIATKYFDIKKQVKTYLDYYETLH